MTQPRASVFRDALQVSRQRIAALSDADLDQLMLDLMRAEAYKCGSPENEVRVNTEGKAKDDGCDGWTGQPSKANDWLGEVNTCWQLKAGTASQPSRIAGEIVKPIPLKTLRDGHRFVLVASGSTNGVKGETDRHDVLVKAASGAGLPTEKIEVIGSERLALWVNLHPVVAAPWARRPEGLYTLPKWAESPPHQVEWQSTDKIDALFDENRAKLDFASDELRHLHIFGHPGVGKTRFALELCRGADWSGSVIYVRQAEDVRLTELLDSAAADEGVRLLVVADEVQPEQLLPLADSVDRGEGRIRLITVGHCPSPEPARIPALQISPATHEQLREIVHGWHPAMPREHVDFVVNFSDGYVRLAKLAADAVARDTRIDVRTLLGREEIRAFFNRMLGDSNRRALYIVAVLDSVGWSGDKSEEGRIIAEALGLNWAGVRADVTEFHNRFGIAPRGGDYCYMSPTPLGALLAAEAWETYPDELRALPGLLPSEKSREAYYKRLSSIASNPQTTEFARTELQCFFQRSSLMDPRDTQLWSALAAADPALAVRELSQGLQETSLEDRLAIKDRARRDLIWVLVKLAWRTDAFHDSVTSLALLAEAENESWSNNATGEFVARYQIQLGGTAVSYQDRLPVLDELLALGRIAITQLVIQALARAGEQMFSRSEYGHLGDQAPEPEWHPATDAENMAAIQTAVSKLQEIAAHANPELEGSLIEAASTLLMMLRYSALSDCVASLFTTLRESYPKSREALRRCLASLLDEDRRFRNELTSELFATIEALHAQFEDESIEGRLQQYVGPAHWGSQERPDLTAIAQELVEDLDALKANWAWLTSGNAGEAWRLGEALAAADEDSALAECLPDIPDGGPDNRLICGYLQAKRADLGDDWFNDWVGTQQAKYPVNALMLIEVAWRCNATDYLAGVVTDLIRTVDISPNAVGQLGYGCWVEQLGAEAFLNVVLATKERGHEDTTVCLLESRIKAKPEEAETHSDLALELVLMPSLIKSSEMLNYYWKELTMPLVQAHARAIAAAIFAAQADRQSGGEYWAVEHSEALHVLNACLEMDPAGCWQELSRHLDSTKNAAFFSIGFSKEALDKVPVDDVLAWVAEDPAERGKRLARLASKDLSSDELLTPRLLGKYADTEDVGNAFFSEFWSGSWSGPPSVHWDKLAGTLEKVAGSTQFPKLRNWATNSARSFRNMAKEERKREEEEELRGR